MRAVYLSIFLAVFSPGILAEWVAINPSKTFYYDPNTFTSEGKFAKVWGIVNYDEPLQNGYPKSKKIFLQSDCHQGQVKTLAFTFTTEKMGKGDTLSEGNNSFGPWRWVLPDTLDEALFNISCRATKNHTEPENTAIDEDEIIDEEVEN